MPNIPFKDGDQVFLEMFLKNANGEQGKTQNLNVMANHIMDFRFTQFQGKTSKATLRLFDETFDSLEDILFSGGALNPDNESDEGTQPVISVKWGWVNGTRRVESAVWDMTLVDYRSKFTYGSGTELDLEFWAAPGTLFKRGNLIAGPKTLQKGGIGDDLSTLVGIIAAKNGITANVEPGKILQEVRQNNSNDFTWLKNVVQYAVKAESGSRNYEVWIRNTSGTPELVVQTQKPSDDVVMWDYLYGLDREGQVLEFETQIQPKLLFSLGAGGFRSVIMDPKTKEFKEVVTNSRTLPGVAGEGKFIPKDSNTPAPLRLGFQSEEAMRAYAAAKYMQLNSTNVQARLLAHGNPVITPSDIVNVIVLRGAQSIKGIEDVHPTSGSYNISGVTHSISDGAYTTELELFRRGNLTATSGGSERTTGSEAASNQVKKAASVFGTNRGDQVAKRIKRMNEDPNASPELKAKYARQQLDSLGN